MRAIISDLDTLRSLKPLELVQYLRAKGWQQDSDLGTKATLWVRADGGADEIVLPKRRDFGDFDLRMSEVLRTLAKTEARSQLDILRDVQTASADLVRLRAPARTCQPLPETRDAIVLDAHPVVVKPPARVCPFSNPSFSMNPDTPCPVCGDLGSYDRLEEVKHCAGDHS